MANEIKLVASLTVSKNGVDTKASTMATLDMSGSHVIHRTQSIGNSAEALDIGDITTCGFIHVRHTGKKADGTAVSDTVSIRIGSGGADVVKLKAGEHAQFRLAASTPHAIASSTNQPVIEYWISED